MHTLFPNLDTVNDSLEIIYDGPSFQGVMEINLLEKEIQGFSYCLKTALKKLKENNKIELDESEIDIFVEGFRHGSFKHRIKWIEKHPATTNALGVLALVFIGVVQIVASYRSAEIKSMSPALMAEIGDAVKVQLLSDQKFLDSLAATINPLKCAEDKIIFKNTGDNQVAVPYEKKACFMELSSAEQADLPVVEVEEELKGRIVMIDIDATKNQIGFKKDGKGNEIRCSIPEGASIDEFKPLLGEWVKISGKAQKKGEEFQFILILGYEQTDAPSEPKQEKMDFKMNND